jgi:hypothetical protein
MAATLSPYNSNALFSCGAMRPVNFTSSVPESRQRPARTGSNESALSIVKTVVGSADCMSFGPGSLPSRFEYGPSAANSATIAE